MVVDDDVARPPLIADLCEATVDALEVAADRSRLQRRRLSRLTQLPAILTADRAAKALRFAEDRRVRHPREAVAHLDRDRAKAAADHGRRDRIDIGFGRRLAGGRGSHVRCGHLMAPSDVWAVRISGPAADALAVHPGGRATVVSR